MAKRKSEDGIACPGCTVKFDAETHAPFMGSCSHSLCGVCVNEKEVEDCPVCRKEGSFKSKQRNELAIEMLAATEGNRSIDSKRPRLFLVEENAAGEPIPAILDSKNRSFLTQIVNKLDPRSFAELAMTSKTMYNFCFDTREVEIAYDISFIPVRYLYHLLFVGYMDEYSPTYYTPEADYRIVTYSGNQFGVLGSAENRKKLQKYPFVFRLKKLLFVGELNRTSLATLRSFLDEFPIKSISEVEVMAVTDWEAFVEFLKDFRIRNVKWVYELELLDELESTKPGRKEAKYLLWNTDSFRCIEEFDDEMILGAKAKRLILKRSFISKETFVDLLKRFANSTEEIRWKLGYDNEEFGHFDLFKALPWKNDEPLPEERPLVFVKNSDSDHKRFRILRKDGKLLKCYSCGLHTVFSTPEFEDECTCSSTEDEDGDEEADEPAEIGNEEVVAPVDL